MNAFVASELDIHGNVVSKRVVNSDRICSISVESASPSTARVFMKNGAALTLPVEGKLKELIEGKWPQPPKPYDAEVEYLGGTQGERTRYRIELPGGDWKGLGWYVKGSVHTNGRNWAPLGIPGGKIFTNWLVEDVYGKRTGVNEIATPHQIIEWWAKDDGERQRGWIKQNGVVKTQNPPIDRIRKDVSPCSGIVFLCASCNTEYVPDWRLYRVTITNFGIPIYDFIPVRVGATGYFYDRVNPTGGPLGNGLYPNLGSGSFVIGPDVMRPYDVEVDYVIFSNGAYVETAAAWDTGSEITMKLQAVVDADISSGSIIPFSARRAGGDGGVRTQFRYPYMFYVDTYDGRKNLRISPNATSQSVLTLRVGETSASVSGDSSGSLSYSGIHDISKTVLIGRDAVNGNLGASIKVHSFQFSRIYDLIRDYIPVRVGTAGYLYDRANPTGGPLGNGLYGSAAATPLIAGPDVWAT